jgi:hypothetical protein
MDKLLISTKNYLAYYDGRSLNRVFEGAFFFYGISQYEPTGEVLVAQTAGEGMDRRSRILRFNKSLKHIGVFAEYTKLTDVHQILCWQSEVFVCASWLDSVDAYNGAGKRLRRWRPYPTTNKLHINSVNVLGGYLYVCAHNLTTRPGEVHVLTPDFHPKGVFEAGSDIHNLARAGDVAYILSSLESKILVVGIGYKEIAPVATDGYLRGLAVSDKLTYVGVSKFADRKARRFGDAEIAVFDRKWNQVGRVALPGAGQVYEVRLVGKHDGGHAMKKIFLDL